MSKAKAHKVFIKNVKSGYVTWPFDNMEVGDYFIVPEGKLNSCRSMVSKIKTVYVGWLFTVLWDNKREAYVCRRVAA